MVTVYMDARINKWFMSLFTWKQMVYEVCLHGYARINKWFMRFVYMDIHETNGLRSKQMVYEVCLHGYTNKQMVYKVCLHGYIYTRINKWFMIYARNKWFTRFVYMDIHEICLHGYTRINKWFTRFVYMDIHE